MHSPRLIYLSLGATCHDFRFIEVAHGEGWHTYWLRCDGRAPSAIPMPASVSAVMWLGTETALTPERIPAFVGALADVAGPIAPHCIQAGPVPTVAVVAVRAGIAPVLVTSWGSDVVVGVEDPDARGRAHEALSGAAHVLVDSQTIAERAITLGARRSCLTVVPWGVDLEFFRYSPIARVVGRCRLLSLRRLEPLYDVGTLIDALALAITGTSVSLELTIAGTGPEALALRTRADHLGLSNIVWQGHVPAAEVAHLLRTHDLHVSTARADGSALSLLEALACGRPSIVTDFPSNAEWITPSETGWIFKSGSAADLADTMVSAAENAEVWDAMGRAGRAVAEERADWARNRRAVAESYRRAVSRGPSSAR